MKKLQAIFSSDCRKKMLFTTMLFMTDRKSSFDQPVKRDLKTYKNIWRIVTGQGDDYTTGCLLDYNYLKKIL